MRINSLFILLFLTIVLSSGVLAQQQTLGTFAQNSEIELTQICANCSYVNVTYIKLGNGTLLSVNSLMTKTQTFYNYTLSSGQTSSFGEYIVNGQHDNNGDIGIWNYNFYITPSGTEFTNALSIPLLLPMGLMLLLMFFSFFLAGTFARKEYFYTFVVLGFIFLVFSIAFGIIASREVLFGFPLLYNFVNSFYTIFIIGATWGSIGAVMVLMFYIIKTVFASKGYYVGGLK